MIFQSALLPQTSQAPAKEISGIPPTNQRPQVTPRRTRNVFAKLWEASLKRIKQELRNQQPTPQQKNETWQQNTGAVPENTETSNTTSDISGTTTFSNVSGEDWYNTVVMTGFEGRPGLSTSGLDDYDYTLGAVSNRLTDKGAEAWGSKDGSLKGMIWAPQQFVVMADIVKGKMAENGITSIKSREDAITLLEFKFGDRAKAEEFVDAMDARRNDSNRLNQALTALNGKHSWKSAESNPAGGVQLAGDGGNKFHA